jgi:hypothetical protein
LRHFLRLELPGEVVQRLAVPGQVKLHERSPFREIRAKGDL